MKLPVIAIIAYGWQFKLLQSLDAKKWTHAKVGNLLAIMDTNKDRCVSYDEFQGSTISRHLLVKLEKHGLRFKGFCQSISDDNFV